MAQHFVARVTGEKPLAFLDATLTQDLGELARGEARLACLLDDKGHVLAELRVIALDEQTVLLDGEIGASEATMSWLARVAPLSGCEVQDVSDEWHVFAVRGPRARAAVSSNGEIPERNLSWIAIGESIAIHLARGSGGVDVLSKDTPQFSCDEVSPSDIDVLRIADGLPRFGVDVTKDLILNETPLIDTAVSFTKGCYPGQETVAKIRNLGKPRRAVAGFQTDELVPRGAALSDDTKEIGTVTSIAATPDGVFGIAVVRAEALDAAGVTVSGQAVRLRRL